MIGEIHVAAVFSHSLSRLFFVLRRPISSCWTSTPSTRFSDPRRAAWQPFAHPREIPLQAVRTWVMAALRLTGSDGSRLMLSHHFAFLPDRYLACVCSSCFLAELHAWRRKRGETFIYSDDWPPCVCETPLIPPQVKITVCGFWLTPTNRSLVSYFSTDGWFCLIGSFQL